MTKSKGKIIGIAVVAAAAAALIAGGIVFAVRGLSGGGKGGGTDKVYVQQVSAILGWNLGANSSYSGKVEAQQTQEITRDADKGIKELLVSVGDAVEVGTPLFTYDTEDAVNQIAQIRLEIEGITNDIASYNGQIADLQKEKKEAPEELQLSYTTQIQTLQTTIRQSEYDKKSKEAAIARYEQAIRNATVKSKIVGVVKSISENGSDPYGNSTPFMVIMATGEYRVKGVIDEQSVYSLSVGEKVVIRSRVDEKQTWSGEVTLIDLENPESGNSGDNYYGESGGESASRYPFYVSVNTTEGLLLGQHVLIEPDVGQGEENEGVWLEESYIVMDEEPYVWAADSKNRLEKRKVELGSYNGNSMQYEILSGLEKSDYVAWPMKGLYEGVTAVMSEEEVDYSSPLYSGEGGDDTWDAGEDAWNDGNGAGNSGDDAGNFDLSGIPEVTP